MSALFNVSSTIELSNEKTWTKTKVVAIIKRKLELSTSKEHFMSLLQLTFDISSWDYYLKYELEHKLFTCWNHDLGFESRFFAEIWVC